MKKLCFGLLVCIFALMLGSMVSELSNAQGVNVSSYGPRQTIWSQNDILTNIYVASDPVDLQSYSGVTMTWSVGVTQALATCSLKPQWGKTDHTGTNIVWADEIIISEAAAAGGTIEQTPYSRVVLLTLNGTNANYRELYSERFNRLDRYFRVSMKSDVATGTQKVQVDVNAVKN